MIDYIQLRDNFCLAAADLIDYAKKYPSNKRDVTTYFMSFMNELQEQENVSHTN